MGGTNGEADLGLSTAYLPLPRFNAPRERSKARRRLDGGSAASGDAGTAVMPRSSAGVAAAQPSAAQPPDHRKRKRDEASEDKADPLFMMVLRKKYPKYVGRCMQEEFDSWLKHVAHGTGFRHDRRGDAYLGIPMDVVGNRDARKRSVSQGAGIQLTLAPGVSPAGHQAFAYSVTFMALLAPRLLRGP